METDAIEDYVQYAERILDEYPQMNEANTKARLIRDLLELLGWDFATDVQLEYSIPMASRTHKVDYALLLEDTPVAFVEAKGCDTSLNDANRDQLRTYMKTQDIDWGLLTNGWTNEVFQRRVEDGKVTVDRLGVAEIDELVQKSNLLSALSKHSIESGEARKIARKINKIEQTKKKLRENKEYISESIARTVAEEVDDSISQQAENEAKTLVDNLIAELDGDTNVESDRTPVSNDFWSEVEQETGITYRDDNVVLRDDLSAVEQFCHFVEFLYKGDYFDETDLPVESSSARYLLHTEPIHPGGDEMFEPKEISDGVYLETHNSTEQKKRFIQKLEDLFC